MNHALKVLHVLRTTLLPRYHNITRLYVCHKANKRSIYLSIYLSMHLTGAIYAYRPDAAQRPDHVREPADGPVQPVRGRRLHRRAPGGHVAGGGGGSVAHRHRSLPHAGRGRLADAGGSR